MKSYWIKKVVPYRDQLVIQLYLELQYSDGISNYITVANKEPFNKLKAEDIVNIDTGKIANYSSKNWFSDESVISRVEF